MKLLTFIILLSPSLSCQSFFFEKGVTSLSGTYGYTGNNTSTNNGGDIILSAAGYVDLGVSFSSSALTGTNIEMSGTMPSISYTLRKADRLGGVRLTVGYMFANLNAKVFNQKLELDVKGPVIGVGVGIPVATSENIALFILPSLSLSFLSAEGEEAENSKGLSLQLPFRYSKGAFGFIISPGISGNLDTSSESAWSFGISAGLLLNLTSKKQN